MPKNNRYGQADIWDNQHFEAVMKELPPYSPDYNEIEHRWFGLKNWMRQRWDEFDSFHDCIDAAFNQCPNVYA